MLKTKSRHVPIRLLCLMATFLAMALPARADWSIKVGDNTYPCTKTSGGETGTQHWESSEITLSKWNSFYLEYTGDEGTRIFGRNNIANIGLNNGATNKYGALTEKASAGDSDRIYWESDETTVKFQFDFNHISDDACPYNFYVEESAQQSQPSNHTVYAIGRFKNSENAWDNPATNGVLLPWNEEANAYSVAIPYNTDNAFRLNIDGTPYYPANVTGGSPYLITNFGADNKLDMATTESTPDCWGVKPMDENATYTLYVDPEANKVWVTKEGGQDPDPVTEWSNYYLILESENWAVNEANKFSQTDGKWSVTLPELSSAWRILGYNSDSEKQHYASSGSDNEYGFNSGWKNDPDVTKANGAGKWKITDNNGHVYNATITFEEENHTPKNVTVAYSTEAPVVVTAPDFDLEYGSTTSSMHVTRTTDDGVLPAVYTVTIPEYADQTWMRLIGTAGNVNGKFYGPASDVNQTLNDNEWSGNIAINQATADRQKVVRVNTGGKTGELTFSFTCNDADASDLRITSIKFVPEQDPTPVGTWKIILSPAHDLTQGTEYSVTAAATNGTKTEYVSEEIDITNGLRVVITDGTNKYYRKSNNDNNTNGWYINRNNTQSHPYTEMPNTPISGQNEVYLHFNSSQDIKGVQLHFTYDTDDNGTRVTNIYYTQEEWGGVFGADYPHVYLLSTVLNNNVVTPEYRLMSTDGKKTFHLNDFAIRSNDCRTAGNPYDNNDDQNYTIRVYYTEGRYIDLPYTAEQAGVPSLGADGFNWAKGDSPLAGQPGWAADATFTLVQNGTSLAASTLEIKNAGSGQWKNNYLPYVGILGEKFVQENKYTTPLSLDGKMGNTDLGWQEAYIQYDAAGRPIIQDGHALYNTLWPPRENILMQAKLEGLNVPLNISTRTLRFWPDMDANGQPRVQTGAQWKKELSAEDSDAYAGLDFTTVDTHEQRYIRYTCTNMWMQGPFKVWTGWSGQQATWGAQWNNHLYFSAWNDKDKDLEAGKTYYASSNIGDGNFNVAKRSFFGTVELFIPVDKDNCLSIKAGNGIQNDNMGDTRIYVTKPKIQAQIDATKNNTRETAYYHPTVAIPDGCTVSAYKIVRCDFTVNPGGDDPTQWQPVNRDYRYREHTDAEAIVAEYSGDALNQDDFNARFTADITGGDGNPWNLDGDLASGTYFYYMQITYNDGEKDRDMVVTSPYLAVIAGEYETSVRVYQLVRNLQDPTGNSYVTYNPNINVQYDVTVEDGHIVSHSQRAATDRFDYSSADAEWTSLMAVATNLPGLYRFNSEPTIARKTATKFEIRYNGEQVADLAAEANRVFADRPGTTFYALKDFMDYDNGKFLDFTGDWDADFTAVATFTNGSTETRETKPENRMKNHLDLTMPAYGIGNVEFMVNSGIAAEETADVKVADTLAGTGHIHAVEGALVNSLDVKVSLTRPNVDSHVLRALNAQLKAESLAVGDKAYGITYVDGTPDKSVTLYSENPNDWIDSSWKPIEKTVNLAAADGASRFVNPNLRHYVAAANQSKAAKLEAQPLQLADIRIPALRAKIKVLDADGQEQNKFEERIYMVKTNLPLAEASRSQLGGVTLNTNAKDEYMVLRKGEDVMESNYVNVENWLEKETLANRKHYHRFSEIENTENMVMLKKSENTSTWYDGMTDDHWVDETTIPAVTLGVVNFFKGDTRAEGEGVMVQTPAAAPATQADGETATHYVLYPPTVQGTLDFSMIQTALDSVEADSLWIEAGAGFFTVKADGVAVYDAAGIKVAAAQGRYDVPAGVYLALKGSKAVKIYVR